MVDLKEIQNLFWGVTLEGEKRYSQIVDTAFHISMAALEPADGASEVVSVMLQHEDAEFLLCSLQQGKLFQQPLDLNFIEGEQVTFFLTGKGRVHLTGYLSPEEEQGDFADMSGFQSGSEEESSEEEGIPVLEGGEESDSDVSDESPDVRLTGKRKRAQENGSFKRTRRRIEEAEESSEEEEEEEEEFEEEEESDEEELDESELINSLLDGEAEEGDWETEEEEDEEEDSDEEEGDAMDGSFRQRSAKKQKKVEVVETPKSDKKKAKQKGTEKQIEKQIDTPNATLSGKKNKKKKNKAEKTPASDIKKMNLNPVVRIEVMSPNLEKKAKVAEESVQNTPASDAEKSGKKKKKNKKNKKGTTPNEKGDASAANGVKQNKGQTPKEKGTPKDAGSAKKGKKTVLQGGLVVEEVKEGHGPEAKPGKMTGVYYTGKLTNKKQFDSTTSGTPFKFRLGKNEVIKGWDEGVKGMKVGGKRKLTVPAKLAYGNRSVGPIPANSTLVFDIELKSVS